MRIIFYFILLLLFGPLFSMEVQVSSHISRQEFEAYQARMLVLEVARERCLKKICEPKAYSYDFLAQQTRQVIKSYSTVEGVKSLASTAAQCVAKLLVNRKFDAARIESKPDDIQALVKKELIITYKRAFFDAYKAKIKPDYHSPLYHNPFISVTFRSDGNYAFAFAGTNPELWDLTKYPDITQMLLKGHHGRASSGCFNKSGLAALTGDRNGSLFLWDLKSLPKVSMKIIALNQEHQAPHEEFVHRGKAITFCALSPDTQYAVTHSQDGNVALWHLGDQSQSVELLSGCDETKDEHIVRAEFGTQAEGTSLQLINAKNKIYQFVIDRHSFQVSRCRIQEWLHMVRPPQFPDQKEDMGLSEKPTIAYPAAGPLVATFNLGNDAFAFWNTYQLADKLSLQELVAKAQSFEKK